MSSERNPLVSALVLVLKDFPTTELHALYNSITWQDKLPNANISFTRAKESGFVLEDGTYHMPKLELTQALEFEINVRAKTQAITELDPWI